MDDSGSKHGDVVAPQKLCECFLIFPIRIPGTAMPPSPIPTEPRKQPRQARSRATVEALLEATAQVLVAHDYKGSTTARIAERAGVSIGSLYQYFPNLESLVAALVDRHAQGLLKVMDRALEGDEAASLEGGLRALIHAGLDMQRLDPALHRVLMEQLPNVDRLRRARDTSRRLTGLIEAFLCRHASRLAAGREPALAAVVVETSLEAVAHRAVSDYPSAPEQQRLQDELYDLLLNYLTGPSIG